MGWGGPFYRRESGREVRQRPFPKLTSLEGWSWGFHPEPWGAGDRFSKKIVGLIQLLITERGFCARPQVHGFHARSPIPCLAEEGAEEGSGHLEVGRGSARGSLSLCVDPKLRALQMGCFL